jgi:hypothetical protein
MFYVAFFEVVNRPDYIESNNGIGIFISKVFVHFSYVNQLPNK